MPETDPAGRLIAGTASEPTIRILADPPAVAAAAAERVAASLVQAVARRGHAHLAATGGSTPVGIYRHLATSPLREAVPWDRIDVWFGDDRYVRRDHPLSNVLLVDQGLLGAVPLPFDHVHPFPCAIAIGEAKGPAWCAATYADEVRAAVPHDAAGWPIFDLVLVGIGPDGHLLSVFPGSPALTSVDLGLAIPAPTQVEPHVERVTLNPAILGTARDLMVIVQGPGKASVLGRVFGPERDPSRWPAQLARRGGATWLIDDAAAAGLPGA